MKKTFILFIVGVLIFPECKKEKKDKPIIPTQKTEIIKTIENKAWGLINFKNIPITKVEASLYADINAANKITLTDDLKKASVVLYSPPAGYFLTFNVLEAQEQGWMDFASELAQLGTILDQGKSVYTIKWSDKSGLRFQTLAIVGQADTLIFDSMMSYPIVDIDLNK
jgi:hypothetical protein